MSFLSSIPQLASLVAQPAVLAAGVATGVAVGTLGVATGVIPVTETEPAARLTALYECPGSGRVVTSLASDQSVLVTARTADGTWLQLYIGQPGAERGWARASSLSLQAAPDALPIADCVPAETPDGGPATLGPPSVEPSGSLDVPSEVPGTATPAPSSSETPTPAPTPTPTPTAAPTPTAPTGPTVYDLKLNDVPEDPVGSGMYPIYQPGCTGGVFTYAPFSVFAVDPDGIQTVTLYYQPTNGSVYSTEMGEEGGGEYYGYFDANEAWDLGEVEYWVQAVDGVGDVSPILYGSSSQQLIYAVCND